MCCENHAKPRPMSREEIAMRAGWQRERELEAATRLQARLEQADAYKEYLYAQVMKALQAQANTPILSTDMFVPAPQPMVVEQPSKSEQPVARELVLA